MFRSVIFIFNICLAFCAVGKYRDNTRDCRVANFPGARNVDFRKVVPFTWSYTASYPDLFYHQLNFGNSDNLLLKGVSFITRLTDDTVSTYASGRNRTTLDCGVAFLVVYRNVPAGSSTLRLTAVSIPEPFTQTFLIAAFDPKSHIMLYQCRTPLGSNGVCPPGQSQLFVETTTEKLSKRVFKLAWSVARRLCIDPNEVLFLRDSNRPQCPKVLELRAQNERRMRQMKGKRRGYGHPAW